MNPIRHLIARGAPRAVHHSSASSGTFCTLAADAARVAAADAVAAGVAPAAPGSVLVTRLVSASAGLPCPKAEMTGPELMSHIREPRGPRGALPTAASAAARGM